MIDVAIVEDDANTRRVLCEILAGDPELRVVGDHGTGEEALRELPRIRPNLVLMDVNLPGISGVECVGQLAARLPGTQIVMLTVFEDTEVIFRSLSLGASGYLLKPVRPAALLAAVHDVIAGGAPLTSNIARKVVQSFQQQPRPENEGREKSLPIPPEYTLSPREREVLDYLAQGYLYKEIAKELGVSYSTIHTYIERIYQKLHVRSRAQAVAKVNSWITAPRH